MSGTPATPTGQQSGPDGAPDLRAAALEYDAAGLCVIPVKADGTKSPDLRSWTNYIGQRSTPSEHDSWFGPQRNRGPRTGIGVVFGRVSGNVEMLEFEGRAIAEGYLERVAEIAQDSGLGEMWKQVTNGWVRRSPSGGLHFHIRVEDVPVKPNTKLAARPARDDELSQAQIHQLLKNPGKVFPTVLIETRGEGGFAVVEPSHGAVHRSGIAYTRETGTSDTIPTLSAEMYAALHSLMRAVDEMPAKDTAASAPRDMRAPLPGGLLRPGEDYENKVDWSEILEPEDWRFVHQQGRIRYWCRPGKDRGVSATTGRDPGRDRLYVFSSSTDFEAETPYTKFGAYALLRHGGDHKAAARALATQGYGDKPPHRGLDGNIVPPRPGPAAAPTGGAPNAPADAHGIPPEAPGVPRRPKIDITLEADGIDGILAAMAEGSLPDLYKRATGLCWIDQDEQGHPVMHQVGPDNLRAYLHEHTATYVVAKDKELGGTKDVPTLPHPRTCATILGRRDWPLPRLRGIVTSPVIRPDGSLLSAPGYDDDTGLYLHPHAKLRRLSEQVTAERVAAAKDVVLGQMLADFPWQAESDRAHFLGALLTPILRHYFHGPTPMFIITATDKGSGKTLLKDIFGYCYSISSTPWSSSEEELRKSITAQLHTKGQPVVVFDNLPNGYVIKSGTISALLTSEYWGDRVLGSTETVTMPNDRVWIMTGNALQTGGDNARRAVWVRLMPDCPDPDQRDQFTVGDLRPWMRRNASTVVAALVTMVRGWLTLGGGQSATVRMGDYSEWAGMVGGVLEYLGIGGWMVGRTKENSDRDAEIREWGDFLAAWWAKFGDRKVTSGNVLEDLDAYVPQGGNGLVTGKQLGRWLGARNGRYFGEFRLLGTPDSHTHQTLWRVEQHQPKPKSGSAR